MSGQIFISYRRDGVSHLARRLYDRLSSRFPKNQIFMDVDAIDPGEDFVKAIEKTVAESDVLIAVIGPHWLTSAQGKVVWRQKVDPADLRCSMRAKARAVAMRSFCELSSK